MAGRGGPLLGLALTVTLLGGAASGQTPEQPPSSPGLGGSLALPENSGALPGSAALPVNSGRQVLPGSLVPPANVGPIVDGSVLGPPGPAGVPGPDPWLDLPGTPPPGWLAIPEFIVDAPHLKQRLGLGVVFPAGPHFPVHVPTAPYDWTVSPRLEVGYVFPHGFGEFSVSYRYLGADGSANAGQSPNNVKLDSRLEMNVVDLLYSNREIISACPWWQMRWKVGARIATMFFDARAGEPFTDPALGPGVNQTRTTNFIQGIGPMVGLELNRQICDTGLAFYGRVEGSWLFVHLHQEFEEDFLAPGMPAGVQFLPASNEQGVGTWEFQAGLRWTPQWHHCNFFLGYLYEFWYQVGRNDRTTSRADFESHGISFRGEIPF